MKSSPPSLSSVRQKSYSLVRRKERETLYLGERQEYMLDLELGREDTAGTLRRPRFKYGGTQGLSRLNQSIRTPTPG